MKDRQISRLAFFFSVVLAALIPVAAAAQPSAVDQLYTIKLRQDTAADAPNAIAADIAAAHRGSLAGITEDAITLRLSPTLVPVVAADPRVEMIVPHAGDRITAATETATWSTGVAYEYDGSGNVRKIGSDYFIYDHVGRLVQSDANGVRRNYEYDRYGNRTKCIQAEGSANESDCQFGYAADPANNRIIGMTYDAAGNATSFGSHTYTYDALNMQTRDASGFGAREYVYTADDERLATYDGNTWRWTVRDTSGKVLREFTSSGSLGTANWAWSKDYIWRNGLLLASRQLEPGGSTPVTYHYHLDHLGTPRRITDHADRIVGIHDYHAFGPEVSGGHNERSLSLMKFTGHERDVVGLEAWDTLDYMHARYASGTLGRFLSVDPVLGDPDKPQSWNRYAYALNNPLRYIDPDGRDEEVEVKYPPASKHWTPEQRDAWNRKWAAENAAAEAGEWIVTEGKPERSSSFRRRLEKIVGPLPPDHDADHPHSLVGNGLDDPAKNGGGLDSSVNRSAGRLLKNSVKAKAAGTRITKFNVPKLGWIGLIFILASSDPLEAAVTDVTWGGDQMNPQAHETVDARCANDTACATASPAERARLDDDFNP